MTDVKKLVELLGSESGSRWIEFMDELNAELGHILRRGKPKAADIENSMIGRLGFGSWAEMVQAPTEAGGLSWNLATFDSWRRAYSVVQKYAFLREYEFSASQINTFQRETKPNFPDSQDALDAFLAARNDSQESLRLNSLRDAQKRADELKAELIEVRQTLKLESEQSQLNLNALGIVQQQTIQRYLDEIKSLSALNDDLRVKKLETVNSSTIEIATLKTMIAELESTNSQLSRSLSSCKADLDRAKRKLDKLAQMSIWQKIKNAFQ